MAEPVGQDIRHASLGRHAHDLADGMLGAATDMVMILACCPWSNSTSVASSVPQWSMRATWTSSGNLLVLMGRAMDVTTCVRVLSKSSAMCFPIWPPACHLVRNYCFFLTRRGVETRRTPTLATFSMRLEKP